MVAALGIDPAWMLPTFEWAAGWDAGRGWRRRPTANAVGVGVLGRVALSAGTSGVIFAATDEPLCEPAGRVHAFCHAVPGRWNLMSVMLSAAGRLRRFCDAVAPGVAFGDLAAAAGEVRPGSDGLLFLPYLSGERSPYPDPLARGAFVRLKLAHDRRHLTRAPMEGVAFGLWGGLDLMVAAGMPRPSQFLGSGRRSASPLWRQSLADVLSCAMAPRRPPRARCTGRRCSPRSARDGS